METELKGKTFQEALSDYLKNYSVEKNMASKTVQNKKDVLNRLHDFLGDDSYNIVTVRHFISHLFNTGWKTPNSRLDLVRMLRAFTNFLYERGYLKESFAKQLIKPKVPKREFTYVDPEIVEQIIIAGTEPSPVGVKGDNSRNRKIKLETRDALRTILRTGLRITETATLEGSDIRINDIPPSFVVTSKGGDRDLLPIPGDLITLFGSRLDRKRVFPVTEKTCNAALRRGCERIGIKERLTCHDLRHIFATNLVKNDVQLQKVQRLLRHESIETTNSMYTHLNVNDLAIVVNQQSIVRNGLEPQKVLDLLEETIKRTGIEKDSRFEIVWSHGEGSLSFKIFPRSSQ